MCHQNAERRVNRKTPSTAEADGWRQRHKHHALNSGYNHTLYWGSQQLHGAMLASGVCSAWNCSANCLALHHPKTVKIRSLGLLFRVREHSHVTCTPMTMVGKSIAVYVCPIPATSQPRAVIFCSGSHRIVVTERSPFFTPYITSTLPYLFTSPISPLLFITWGASQFLFFYFSQQTHLTVPSLKSNEAMEASQNRTFCFEVWSSFPLAHLYRWKEDNICQSIGSKSEVLWRTCWETHWELGERIENLTRNSLGTWREHIGNQGKKESTLSACLGLPIGCMKFLFPSELVTILG